MSASQWASREINDMKVVEHKQQEEEIVGPRNQTRNPYLAVVTVTKAGYLFLIE